MTRTKRALAAAGCALFMLGVVSPSLAAYCNSGRQTDCTWPPAPPPPPEPTQADYLKCMQKAISAITNLSIRPENCSKYLVYYDVGVSNGVAETIRATWFTNGTQTSQETLNYGQSSTHRFGTGDTVRVRVERFDEKLSWQVPRTCDATLDPALNGKRYWSEAIQIVAPQTGSKGTDVSQFNSAGGMTSFYFCNWTKGKERPLK